MSTIEIRRDILLSMQRALLGMVYPSIRAIAVGFYELVNLKIIFYLDREPNETDYEIISEVATEVCADINFMGVEEICVFSTEPIAKLDSLIAWVYVRKERFEQP
jgi:hypothetical protein